MKKKKVRLYLFAFFMIVVSVSLILISLAIISEKEEAIDVKAMIEESLNIELEPIKNIILAVEDIDGDEIYEFIIGLYCSGSSYPCILSSERELKWIKGFGVTPPFSLGDIDSDGFDEVVILEGALLSIFNSFGELFKSYSLSSSGPLPQMIKPLLIDLNDDGIQEIILAGVRELFQFNINEEMPRLIPLQIGDEDKIISIAGRDRKGEIVVGTRNGMVFIILGGKIKVIETGHVYEEYFVKNPEFVVYKNILLWPLGKNIIGYRFNNTPLFGDRNFIEINEKVAGLIISEIDKLPVIAVSTIDGMGYLLNMKGELLSGWPVEVSYPAPIYAKSLIINSKIIFISFDGNIKGYNVDGSFDEGFGCEIEGSIISTPILKDLNQDGRLELVIVTADGRLHILNLEEDLVEEVDEEVYDEEFYEEEWGEGRGEEYYQEEGEEGEGEYSSEEYLYTGPTHEGGETDGEYVVYEVEPAYVEPMIRFFDRYGREITGEDEEEESQEKPIEKTEEELEEKAEVSKEPEEETQIQEEYLEEEMPETREVEVGYPESIELPVTRTEVYHKEEPAFEMPGERKIEIIQKEKPKAEIPLHQSEIFSPKDEFEIFLKLQQRITDFFKRIQRLFGDKIRGVYFKRKA